jgi:hypothetical protein
LFHETDNCDGTRGSECNRGTGCGKTARPGLWRGSRVTGFPTPDVRGKQTEFTQGEIKWLHMYR